MLLHFLSAATGIRQLPQDNAGSTEAANNGHNDFEIPNHCLPRLFERISLDPRIVVRSVKRMTIKLIQLRFARRHQPPAFSAKVW
ncbi:hypothetical protein HGP16_13020 [Rhizobium sp. P40RR-XXII]|uniref:hypothetical protein n=1 Tax=unclassified Rhizobium TaxID=2613769 RepID=UPI001456701D|nr:MULTISPECIES: hypothetical protein [unclassified Rhizobium]NLR86808.1 hypothetical protein [Rhizobium sp. P28RR-XV]NLS17479.1 hypothetical protein [Rhizobium sp. P40RR-XXII]